MSCQIEQVADCGDLATIARALFITEREDPHWLTRCSVSLSSCGNLLAIAFKKRLCLLTTHWISSTDSHTYLITWSGTLSSDILALLALPLCPTQHSSQSGPDWFCIIVGFENGHVGFYTNTGHLLVKEKLDEKPVMKISCHTGTYGTLPDDLYVFFQSCFCVISGSSLFQVLRNAKAELAKVQAGIQDSYNISNHNIYIRKWNFCDQDTINDAAVVGIELKNSYDHLLAASTYGGYDTWYRSVPPVNTLMLGAGAAPYLGFHYALEGGTTPPLQDVARAVASKIKSVLPGWLGGGSNESQSSNEEPVLRAESLLMRAGIYDSSRHGSSIVLSPDRRLAAVADNVGRVTVLDVQKGHVIRIFKGYRDAQCAFIQVFDVDNKKPQLSVVKEIKRAIFLIIYNPKKGLIDIRTMQNGKRVAVFTATKNGVLLYNTCGLVGAEKNYIYKKLNLPEFQCALLDSDGKLKKFNIPFCYALDGTNSARFLDLQTLRELRDYIRKSSSKSEEFQSEICKQISTLKTLELKKHCLELLIMKYGIVPKLIASCLDIFWDSISEVTLNEEEEKIKHFFANLTFVTLFYRHINNECTDDMQQLICKVQEYIQINCVEDFKDENELEFYLLEDDNCILERLLHLTTENGYKDNQNTKVTFLDSYNCSYKDFISCFVLDEITDNVNLKLNISDERLDDLASDVFNLIFNVENKNMLTKFIQMSKIDPKEIVKLIIRHVMQMPLEEVTISLIERMVAVFYHVCRSSQDATNMTYNEISPWWQYIRDILVDMSCPLRSMIVAMAFKAVSKMFECKNNEDEAWVSVTKENAKWGILIGKLEDISILSIILMFKEKFTGQSLPTLKFDDFNINLKYIYTRGKGSVTELIAKWLCSMGVPPEAITVNELMDLYNTQMEELIEDDGNSDYIFIQNHRAHVDSNPKIFKWLSLLRRQFPLSTRANYLIANMCWEYALYWQKCTQSIENLTAVVHCLDTISDLHLRLGLSSIIWSTYIKQVFEATCRLVNKVGRLPKDGLCLQDIGFSNAVMTKFLEMCTNYLEHFQTYSETKVYVEKMEIQYENIWNESMPSLVEIAQDTKSVHNDVLNLNYQISCTIYYQCILNIKYSKPLDTLFDVDYQYVFDALTGEVPYREVNTKISEKVKTSRLKYLTKLIRTSIDTITYADTDGNSVKQYNNEECMQWIQKILNLALLWNVDSDFISKQQVIGLYHMGYDTLAEHVLSSVRDALTLLPPLVAISIQRLKRSQARSKNQAEWIVTVPPHLYKRLQNTPLDTSIPAQPSLATTMLVMEKLLYKIDKTSESIEENKQEIKFVELIIETCNVLLKRKL